MALGRNRGHARRAGLALKVARSPRPYRIGCDERLPVRSRILDAGAGSISGYDPNEYLVGNYPRPVRFGCPVRLDRPAAYRARRGRDSRFPALPLRGGLNGLRVVAPVGDPASYFLPPNGSWQPRRAWWSKSDPQRGPATTKTCSRLVPGDLRRNGRIWSLIAGNGRRLAGIPNNTGPAGEMLRCAVSTMAPGGLGRVGDSAPDT